MSITISLTDKEAKALISIIDQWDYRAPDETEYDEIAHVISEKILQRLTKRAADDEKMKPAILQNDNL